MAMALQHPSWPAVMQRNKFLECCLPLAMRSKPAVVLQALSVRKSQTLERWFDASCQSVGMLSGVDGCAVVDARAS